MVVFICSNTRTFLFDQIHQYCVGSGVRGVFDFISDDDQTIFENEPLQNMAKVGSLFAFKHHGFWKCMDTLRDKTHLEDLWTKGNSPWKVWV